MTVTTQAGSVPRSLSRAMDLLEDRYEDMLAWLLDRPRQSMALGVLLGLLTAFVVVMGMVRGPSAAGDDADRVVVEVRGTTAEVTRETSEAVERAARTYTDVATTSISDSPEDPTGATVLVHLTLVDGRRTLTRDELASRLRRQLEHLPGPLVSVYPSGIVARPVKVEIAGPDSATLGGVSRRIADELGQIPGVVDLTVKRAGAYEASVEGNLEDRTAREVKRDITARLSQVPLPPGYEEAVTVTTPGAKTLKSFAGSAALLPGLLLGTWQVMASSRIVRRRRVRGDSPRVAAVIAARRRFRPTMAFGTLLLVVLIVPAVLGPEELTRYAITAAISAALVTITTLLVLPVFQSRRPGAAR